MAAVEIVLLVCGIVCIVASFIFDFGDRVKDEEQLTTTLTAEQKDKIKEQIIGLIDEELENLNEKTEASLDKISNTKILELNEYAESILGQINRNHNETVFLYDMLNEKAKEVKNTVRDVNVAKQQIESMQRTGQTAGSNDEAEQNAGNSAKKTGTPEIKDAARERLAELVRKSNEKSRKTAVKSNQAEELDKLVSEDTSEQNKSESESVEAVEAAQAVQPEAADIAETDNSEKTVKTTKPVSAKTTTARKTTRKSADKSKDAKPVALEAANMNIQFDKGANNNDKILQLYNMGLTNKDIAKQLNLGVGEVKLVIDLYNGGK